MDQELMHYGIKRRSGRYPWGSGDNPYQRLNNGLAKTIADYKAKGMSESDIAAALGFKRYDKDKKDYVGDTRGLRAAVQLQKEIGMRERQTEINKLKAKGYSEQAIADALDISKSTVHLVLSDGYKKKETQLLDTTNNLKDYADQKQFLDVGKGINLDLGVSPDTMKNALSILEAEGYHVYPYRQLQMGTGHYTDRKILCPPDVTYAEMCQAFKNGDVKAIQDYHVDTDGMTKCGMDPPVSIDSKRIMVKYAEDGGTDMDGIVELRRGVDDISLGKGNYAQVRIAVDGTHYIKGMAIYADDLPPGIDLRVNSNKHVGTPLTTDDPDGKCVLKPMKLNPDGSVNMDNPFGATIKPNEKLSICQKSYLDENGVEHRSAINVVKEPGDVGEWKKTLSSQFLSKQPVELVERQINQALVAKNSQYDDIMSINNPTIRKKMLLDFADECDSDAVDLHAAALPRQSSKFILSFSDMKENEVYAPTYNNGEKVALVRYPHAGVFEIPVLTVNNKRDNKAKNALQNAEDAIGIHPKAAAQLSGADSDGDTVLVIPVVNAKGEKIVNVRSHAPYEELQNFDTKERYPMPKGVNNAMQDKQKGDKLKQREMGMISNLITDMTLKGAPPNEIIRADKYSMVVIDAQKHNLNYKQAYKDLNIKQLYDKWRSGSDNATVVSQASTEYRVPEKRQGYRIDSNTGEKITLYTGRKVKALNPETGKYELTDKIATTKSTRMAETKDARTLLSKNPNAVEMAYANYANELKAMGNKARLAYTKTKDLEYSPSANKQYASQVASIDEKLLKAQKNAPKERLAQDLAGSWYHKAVAEDPSIKQDKDKQKKLRNQFQTAARAQLGANKKAVEIYLTDDEYKAIQAGAVHKTKVNQILANANKDRIRQLSMPKQQTSISDAQRRRIVTMYNSGKTLSEIASAIGISPSSVWSIAVGD